MKSCTVREDRGHFVFVRFQVCGRQTPEFYPRFELIAGNAITCGDIQGLGYPNLCEGQRPN